MNKIINTSQAQKNMGKISKTIGEDTYIVTNHGKGRIVMLPYFDGCDGNLSDYMEDYEMMKNKEKLQKEFRDSLESGESSLEI